MSSILMALVAVSLVLSASAGALAAEIRVLAAGAFKQVVLALVPEFEKRSGHTVKVDNDTAGAFRRRIEGGEGFDVAVITPAAIEALIASGKVVPGSRTNLATVGVGVMVRDGALKPDVSSVDAFKRALLAAKTVAYIDPASGGSSGIYIDKLLERLGIAGDIRPKAKLKKGGYVADLLVAGEAELGLHQISEIVPVKGVTLVGPLPPEIQNVTTYAAGRSVATTQHEAAQQLVKLFSGASARAILQSKGMQPAS